MNGLFREHASALVYTMPSLAIKEDDEKFLVKGTLTLTSEDSDYCENYEIEILPTPEYPYQFPKVFETGGRIPKNVEWHIFEDSGNCCLAVPAEEKIICKNGIDLIGFMENIVKPYFNNQVYRKRNGFFLKERSHGLKGILEFYQDKLNEKNAVKAIRLLEFIATKTEPQRTKDCFCGSGKKYRKCHRNAYRLLDEAGSGRLALDAEKLAKLPSDLLTKWSK